MNRVFYCFSVLGLLALGLLPLPSAASDNAYCSKPLRVALFEFGVLYRSASSDGIDARLLNTIEQRTGCTIDRVLMPRARIWEELKVGTLDIATAAIATPERKTFGYFLPYMKTRNLLLVRHQSAPATLDQKTFEAGTLRLGVVRGFRHEAAYDTMVELLTQKNRVVLATDVADLMRLIDRGVVDAVLSQPIVFRQYLDEAKVNQDIVLHDWAPEDQFSLGSIILSRKSFTPKQAKRWDTLMVELQRDGTLLKYAREFMPPDQARDLVYTGPRMLD